MSFIQTSIRFDNSYLLQIAERIYRDDKTTNYRLFATFQNCKYTISYQIDKKTDRTLFIAQFDDKTKFISKSQFEDCLVILKRQIEEAFANLNS